MNLPAITGNNIEGNDVGGDLTIIAKQENINLSTNFSSQSNLPLFVSRFKSLAKDDPEYLECIDELNSFFHDVIPRKIKGLEAKLTEGSREDLLEDALYLENKMAIKIAKNQFSPTAEAVYYHCLTRIKTAFTSSIQPLIKAKASHQVVDQAIYDKVIMPIHAEIISTYTALDTEQIKGLLYYLTGKCRIQWS